MASGWWLMQSDLLQRTSERPGRLMVCPGPFGGRQHEIASVSFPARCIGSDRVQSEETVDTTGGARSKLAKLPR